MKKTVMLLLTLSICFAGDNLPAQLENLKEVLQKKYQVYSPEDLTKLKNPSTPIQRVASRDMEDIVGDWMMEEESVELFVTVGTDQSIPDPFTTLGLTEAEGSITATTSEFEEDLNYLIIGLFDEDDGPDCDINCEGEYDDYMNDSIDVSDEYCECCHEDYPLDEICEDDDPRSRDNHGAGVEFEYGSVADLYDNHSSVLESVGADCDNCEGNLNEMEADTSFDITSQAEFENWASNYGFAEYYFQFIDENENDDYDDGEIYAVSCEGENDSNMTVAYDGAVYELQFEDFWFEAYDFDWENEGDDDEDDDGDEWDPEAIITNMSLIEFFMTMFGMDTDSLGVENPMIVGVSSTQTESGDIVLDEVFAMFLNADGMDGAIADSNEAIAATSIDTVESSVTFDNLSLYDSTGTAVLTLSGTIGPGWLDFVAGEETSFPFLEGLEDMFGEDDEEFYMSFYEDSTGMEIEVGFHDDEYYYGTWMDTTYFTWSATSDTLFLYEEDDDYYYGEIDTTALEYVINGDTLIAGASFDICEDEDFEECLEFASEEIAGLDELDDIESLKIAMERVLVEGSYTSVEPGDGTLPDAFNLYSNYPNPFNPVTTIRFDVGQNSGNNTTLRIYDITGRNVATLLNTQLQTGTYEAQWDARGFASGLYFAELVSGTYRHTQKMILMK